MRQGISRFEVGTIPSKPQVFQFYTEDGDVANLAAFTGFNVEMRGTDDEVVDLSGIDIRTDNTVLGRLTIIWPRRKEVFNKTGQYLLRFKFTGPDSADYSETHEIRVTNFGRITN